MDEYKLLKYPIPKPENIILTPSADICYLGSDYDFYYKTYKGLYGYNEGEEDAVFFVDWSNSDIYCDALTIKLFISPETILALTSDLFSTMVDGSNITLLTKIPDDEVEPKVLITLAYTDHPNTFIWVPNTFTMLMQAAYRFNQTNGKYRIVFKDYWQYATTPKDRERPIERLHLDIAKGEIPDMMIIDINLKIRNYTSKNMFVDLYEFLDNDPDLSRNDILGCVRSSHEINGKLYHLPLNFWVYTLIGKSSNVGENPYWNLNDMFQMYNNLPDDTTLIAGAQLTVFDGQTFGRSFLEDVLNSTISDFIDYEKGTCAFTSDEFINLLKFAKGYSIEHKYADVNNGSTNMATLEAIHNNRIYLTQFKFRYMYQYIVLKYLFGEDIVFKGFPTKSGNRSLLNKDFSIGITRTSPVKEGMWQFMKYLLSDEIQNSELNNRLGLPVKVSSLKKSLDTAQDLYYFKLDDVWRYSEVRKYGDSPEWYSKNSVGWDEFWFTQADADNVFNFLNNIEIRDNSDETVFNIIQEEVDIFWAGQITAEQCAAYIQNRVYIYVNEQK